MLVFELQSLVVLLGHFSSRHIKQNSNSNILLFADLDVYCSVPCVIISDKLTLFVDMVQLPVNTIEIFFYVCTAMVTKGFYHSKL